MKVTKALDDRIEAFAQKWTADNGPSPAASAYLADEIRAIVDEAYRDAILLTAKVFSTLPKRAPSTALRACNPKVRRGTQVRIAK